MAQTLLARLLGKLHNKPAIAIALIIGGAFIYVVQFTDSVARVFHSVREPNALHVGFLRAIQNRDSIEEFRRRYLGGDSAMLGHELFPLIDVAFRNVSEQPAVISAVILTVTRLRHEQISMNCSDLAPSAVHHVILDANRSRQVVVITASLSVQPHSADRLAVSVGIGELARVEYDVEVSLRYNDSRTVSLGSTRLTLLPECAVGPLVPRAWIIARGA